MTYRFYCLKIDRILKGRLRIIFKKRVKNLEKTLVYLYKKTSSKNI